MSIPNRLELGQQAETAARCYLEARGCRVILQNFKCRAGELDLVAIDDQILAIIEVRHRSTTTYGSAAESVGSRKRRRIIRATRFLLLTREDLRGLAVRFDVMASDGAAPIDWIKSAFEAGG